MVVADYAPALVSEIYCALLCTQSLHRRIFIKTQRLCCSNIVKHKKGPQGAGLCRVEPMGYFLATLSRPSVTFNCANRVTMTGCGAVDTGESAEPPDRAAIYFFACLSMSFGSDTDPLDVRLKIIAKPLVYVFQLRLFQCREPLRFRNYTDVGAASDGRNPISKL